MVRVGCFDVGAFVILLWVGFDFVTLLSRAICLLLLLWLRIDFVSLLWMSDMSASPAVGDLDAPHIPYG